MPLVIKTDEVEKKVTISPHLALTHNELQGGAANGRNVSLLMKSDVELDDETKVLLKKLLGDDVVLEKSSYSFKRNLLDKAIKEKFETDRDYYYHWAYIEDFDDEYVVWTGNDGLKFAEYSINGDKVSLGESKDANRIVSYKEDTGTLLVSDSTDVRGDTPEGVYSLIVKSFDSISNKDKIKDIFKSKHEIEVKNVEQEIQKALAPVQADLAKAQADLTKANSERDALQTKLDEILKAQSDAKEASRLEAIKAVVKDEEGSVELHKSLTGLDDSAFETVLKSLKAKEAVVEKSELFKQVSGDGNDDEKSDTLKDLIKAKYPESK